MEQIRRYRIREGKLGEFVSAWQTQVAPLRQRMGFSIPSAWRVDETGEFIWILNHTGSEPFAVADAAYYASPSRRAVTPNPADLIESTEEIMAVPVFIPSASANADPLRDELWQPVKPLLGRWRGRSEGVFGRAEVELRWQLALGEQFMCGEVRSAGDAGIDEAMTMIGWDSERGTFVAREFDSKGHINEYRVQLSMTERQLEFVSESVNNEDSRQRRTRRVIRFVADDEIEETLSAASDNVSFEVVAMTRLSRMSR